MDNFDIKKFVSSKSLLNENSPGYYDRKSGEALPTLAGIQAAYEAKNGIDEADAGKTLFDLIGDLEKAIKLKDEDKLRNKIEDLITKYKKVNISEYSNLNEGIITEGKKSELDKKLAEIDREGAINTLEAKIATIDEVIETKENRINMVQEDENLSELIDKKRVKEMQKEIKLLERSKKLYEKQLDKANGVKTEKKEIVDEYNSEPHDEPDMSMDATMDEESEYKY
jgi:hypothetical protein|tara:strand:+ start:803 stop:1480 length:678 start_codon:yes stop_codon:yes gene_type:complete